MKTQIIEAFFSRELSTTFKFGKVELLSSKFNFASPKLFDKVNKKLFKNHDAIICIDGQDAHTRFFTNQEYNTWFLPHNQKYIEFISKTVTEHINIIKKIQSQKLVTNPSWKTDIESIRITEPTDNLIEYFWNHREEILAICQSNPIRASRVIEIIAYLQNSGLN